MSISLPLGDIKRAQGGTTDSRQWYESGIVVLTLLPASQWGSRSNCPSSGVTPVGITEGPMRANLTPHARMSPDNALIYVDNIRDAFIKYDPANAKPTNVMPILIKPRLPKPLPLRKQIAELPENQRWMVTSEGVFLSRTRFGAKRALSVAD